MLAHDYDISLKRRFREFFGQTDIGRNPTNELILKVVGSAALTAENELSVEVTNLGANRIRWNDRTGVDRKRFHDINFISIRGVLEHTPAVPFDASGWPVRPSGLLGPVTLFPV